MNQFIFKSRWIAISFAVLMLFSTYMLVGREDEGGTLGAMQGAVVDQRDDTVAQLAQAGTPDAMQPPEAVMDDAEFVDDEELIDSGEGTDPTPGDEEGGYGDDSADGPQFAPQNDVDDNGDAGDGEE